MISSVSSGSARSRFLLFLAIAVALVGLLFSDAWTSGRVLSQSDILFEHVPWSAHVPAGFTRAGNNLLADVPTVFYPFLMRTATSLRAGALPLWSTALFGGHPFLASFQSATFSPFTLAAIALAPADALLASAMAKLLVGGLGMWLLLRRFGLSWPAVFFGALAYLLNPFSVVWAEHPVSAVSAWLPLLLWSTDRLVHTSALRDVGLLGLFVGIVILAGHPETSYKVLLFAGAYGIAGVWDRVSAATGTRGATLRGVARLLATRCLPAALLGVLLSTVQVLPFAEYLRHSSIWGWRRDASANVYPAPAPGLITSVVPNFYGNPSKGLYLPMENRYGVVANFCEQQIYPGIATWILGAIGLAASWRTWRTRFLTGAAAIAALLMYGAPGIVDLFLLVPGARVIVLTRFGLVTITSAIVLAAYGVDALTRRMNRASEPEMTRVAVWPAVVVTALMAAGIAAFLAWAMHFLVAYDLAARTLSWCAFAMGLACMATLAVWLRARGRLTIGAFATAVCVLVAIDLFALGWRFHPMVPREQLFPIVPELAAVKADPGLFRVAGVRTALVPNAAMAYGLQDLRGYDGMMPALHSDIVGTAHKGGSFRMVREHESFHVLDLMNVKYVFTAGDVHLPAEHFTPIVSGNGARVFRNDHAMPRAFLVARARVAASPDALRLIRAHQVDLRHEVLVPEPLAEAERPDAVSADEGTARVVHYEDERVEIETVAPGRRLLVLGDLDYPGWRVSVDGAPARLIRANAALRAVSVPAGRHVVSFHFEPLSVRIGAWLSIASLVLIGALVGWKRD